MLDYRNRDKLLLKHFLQQRHQLLFPEVDLKNATGRGDLAI